MRAQTCEVCGNTVSPRDGVRCPHCGAYVPDKRCFWILFWLSLFGVLVFVAYFVAVLFAHYVGE